MYERLQSPRVLMCCSPHRFADRAATHYHTRAWQTLMHGKECFILLLNYAAFSASISLSQRRNTLGVLFLTIDVPIKILGHQPSCSHIDRSCCFLISSLISLLKNLNFALIFALPDFFAFRMSCIFSANLPSNCRSYPWD